ncbi:hypothetical protein AADZ86_02730 [Colwelliaceae bacterium BS250]
MKNCNCIEKLKTLSKNVLETLIELLESPKNYPAAIGMLNTFNISLPPGAKNCGVDWPLFCSAINYKGRVDLIRDRFISSRNNIDHVNEIGLCECCFEKHTENKAKHFVKSQLNELINVNFTGCITPVPLHNSNNQDFVFNLDIYNANGDSLIREVALSESTTRSRIKKVTQNPNFVRHHSRAFLHDNKVLSDMELRIKESLKQLDQASASFRILRDGDLNNDYWENFNNRYRQTNSTPIEVTVNMPVKIVTNIDGMQRWVDNGEIPEPLGLEIHNVAQSKFVQPIAHIEYERSPKGDCKGSNIKNVKVWKNKTDKSKGLDFQTFHSFNSLKNSLLDGRELFEDPKESTAMVYISSLDYNNFESKKLIKIGETQVKSDKASNEEQCIDAMNKRESGRGIFKEHPVKEILYVVSFKGKHSKSYARKLEAQLKKLTEQYKIDSSQIDKFKNTLAKNSHTGLTELRLVEEQYFDSFKELIDLYDYQGFFQSIKDKDKTTTMSRLNDIKMK